MWPTYETDMYLRYLLLMIKKIYIIFYFYLALSAGPTVYIQCDEVIKTNLNGLENIT